MPARKVTENPAGRLSVTLDVEDREELEKLSASIDRSLAWVIREAVREYLANRSKQGVGD